MQVAEIRAAQLSERTAWKAEQPALWLSEEATLDSRVHIIARNAMPIPSMRQCHVHESSDSTSHVDNLYQNQKVLTELKVREERWQPFFLLRPGEGRYRDQTTFHESLGDRHVHSLEELDVSVDPRLFVLRHRHENDT